MNRARASSTPAIFWLDPERGHDAQLIAKVERYLPDHDTSGLDVRILEPMDAMRFSLERIRRGEDTISVTGNILRDYLTDLFPILELGTSARMLSIVPLLNGGGLFETGAGGSAPKHVEQFVKENHLRWDSLGEYRALVPSLEKAAEQSGDGRPAILARALDAAIGDYLENERGRRAGAADRQPRVGLLPDPAGPRSRPRPRTPRSPAASPIAEALGANEEAIAAEFLAAQFAVDLGGYYHEPGAQRRGHAPQRDAQRDHRRDLIRGPIGARGPGAHRASAHRCARRAAPRADSSRRDGRTSTAAITLIRAVSKSTPSVNPAPSTLRQRDRRPSRIPSADPRARSWRRGTSSNPPAPRRRPRGQLVRRHRDGRSVPIGEDQRAVGCTSIPLGADSMVAAVSYSPAWTWEANSLAIRSGRSSQ